MTKSDNNNKGGEGGGGGGWGGLLSFLDKTVLILFLTGSVDVEKKRFL